MSTAGARALRGDDNGMSREAVLLQWERKIEDAERRESGRSGRQTAADEPVAEPVPLRPAEDATSPEPRRFERSAPAVRPARGAPAVRPERGVPPRAAPVADTERRTVTIAGQAAPARRRRSVVEAQMAQPDRIALWAFLLGLFLVAVAAGTAHA
jgi:hypothetical protein